MVVVGRQPRGGNCSTIKLSAFMPDHKMAATPGAMLIAMIRPLCGWIEFAFEYKPTIARKFSRGVLDKPFSRKKAMNWRSTVGITPWDFFPYTPDVCRTKTVRSFIADSGRIVVYVINAIAPRGSFVGRRILNIPGKQAFHDTLISHGVDDQARKQLAYTANMLNSAASIYKKLGIHLIYLKAGLSAGGRLWPKYGFLPLNTKEWYKCRRRILSNLSKLPEDVQIRRRHDIMNLVHHPNPLNLRILYQMDDQVPDIIDPNRQRNLGSVLLTRTRWQGVLDLSDGSSESIFRDAIAKDLAAYSPVRTS